jgi:hypothetical protein
VPSHYNFTTPLDAALMRGGAGGTAAVFLIGVVVLLVAAAQARRASAPVRLGVLAGGAVLLIGCLVGLVMIFNNSGVYQGHIGLPSRASGYLGPAAATVGPEYLLLRPQTAGGDLVLPHAVGVHGLVLLAVPAVLAAGTALDRRRQLAVVGTASASVGVALAILLVHALRQLPLAGLGPAALTALAACAAALAACYAVIARAGVSGRRA